MPINGIGRALDRRLGLTRRATDDELMDTLPLSESETRSTLRWLQLTNRYFGGTRTVLRHLAAWSTGWPTDRTMHLLDVGTGAADIPAAIVWWARRRGIPVRVTAIDSAPHIAAAARAAVRDVPEITVEQRDLFELADTDTLFQLFNAHFEECRRLCEAGVALPAYDQCIQTSHVFNLLDARGAISVAERAQYIRRIRELACASAAAWLGVPPPGKEARP